MCRPLPEGLPVLPLPEGLPVLPLGTPATLPGCPLFNFPWVPPPVVPEKSAPLQAVLLASLPSGQQALQIPEC